MYSRSTPQHQEAAVHLATLALSARQATLGPDDSKTLAAKQTLGNALLYKNDIDQAISLFKEVVEDRRRLLGSQNAQTISSMAQLASACFKADRVAESAELLDEVVDTRMKLYGANHPTTIRALVDQHAAHSNAGHKEIARKIGTDAVPAMLDRGRYAQALHMAHTDEMQKLVDSALTQDIDKVPPGIDRTVVAELLLHCGKISEACEVMELATRKGGAIYMFKTKGICQFAARHSQAADAAFRRSLRARRLENGNYNLEGANPDELTSAYFLDLIDKNTFVAELSDSKRYSGLPWLYVGMRHEYEGRYIDAKMAYTRCVEESHYSNMPKIALYRLDRLGMLNHEDVGSIE
ncbi:tetratricopeptide repeat protein [Aeoliella sp. ICT_H6.2]|uniref:Tetratricopeptide repeat protein n=2 Tax=Aeoliella straminimaris TaxID=2954799 RepID=A0A9X2JFB3_9BACT|nr:tetratricopeptide repeat protein [Aeoliella straminimaris]